MKKLTSLVFSMVLTIILSATCFAMQFSQPVELGVSSYGYFNTTGHQIEGATRIKANKYFHPVKKTYTGYDKGYATFDGGKLYVYYDGAEECLVRIGADDRTNTVQTACGRISRINTDSGDHIIFFERGR